MKILFIFGTRPEAIKLAPLIHEFKKNSEFEVKVCSTGQHREMIKSIISFFDIFIDYDLDLMKKNQSLVLLTGSILVGLEKIINEFNPDNIIVQGDTTSVLAGSIAGFYNKISVTHLEAGLRSGDIYSPFPEEINRKVVGHIANYHFAPTNLALMNLKKEGIVKNVWNVGNTVIDSIYLALEFIKNKNKYKNFFLNYNIDFDKKIILVTAHRRESLGEKFEEMCEAIKYLAEKYDDIEIVYPVHLNPNVQKIVQGTLSGTKNIHLLQPLDYPFLVWLMNQSYFVLTDSGGIQEEAPSLNKPVLVMRDITERQEGIDAGVSKLVSTNKESIIKAASNLLENQSDYEMMAKASSPYGDGTASRQIVNIYKKIKSGDIR